MIVQFISLVTETTFGSSLLFLTVMANHKLQYSADVLKKHHHYDDKQIF